LAAPSQCHGFQYACSLFELSQFFAKQEFRLALEIGVDLEEFACDVLCDRQLRVEAPQVGRDTAANEMCPSGERA
jgi:hypothetical protein